MLVAVTVIAASAGVPVVQQADLDGAAPGLVKSAASAGVPVVQQADLDGAAPGLVKSAASAGVPVVQQAVPEMRFVSVAAGLWHACGLRSNGTVVCLGDNEHGQSDAPAGEFTAIAAGHYHTCGIRVDATLVCWGEAPLSPTGEFTALEAGGDWSCALRVDGAMACWAGERPWSLASPLESESGEKVRGAMMQGPFEVVAVHDYTQCGLRSDDNTIECSGYDPVPSGEQFAMISIGADAGWEIDEEGVGTIYICGVLLSDSTVSCWGDGFEPLAAMDGHFDSVVVGGYHACGLRTGGVVSCWWMNLGFQALIQAVADADPEFMETMDWKMTDAPGGRFSDLDASMYLSCGVRTNGTIACWGRNDSVYEQFNRLQITRPLDATTGGDHMHAPASTPDTRPLDATTGGDHMHAPASTPDPQPVRTLEVFHDNSYTYLYTPTPGTRTADSVASDPCDGPTRSSPIDPASGEVCGEQERTPPRGEFTAIAAGAWQTCAIRTDHTVACWGINPYEDYGQARAPRGEFTAIATGIWHSCAIRTDRTAVCWGRDTKERLQPPVVVAGDWRYCAIRTDDTVTCRNSSDYSDRQVQPIQIEFTAITAGGLHSCGIRTDDTVVCWGTSDAGAPQEDWEFTAISAGARHSCGIRTDRTATCWADDSDYKHYGRVKDTPAGEFTAIAVGGAHACGITPDRAATCWGSDALGQLQAPDGEFAAIATGAWHSCAIRTDRTIACWGDDQYRQTHAPDGQFVAITAGVWHSCGIRTDRTIACWGAETLADRRALPQHMSPAVEVAAVSDSGGR